jgi:hypothetical protein
VEVILLNVDEYRMRFPSDVKTLFQNVVFSVSFSILETKRNHKSKVRRVGRMGNANHVVASHKLCSFQGCMGGRVVVMKESVVVAPKFQVFVAHFLSSVSKRHGKS